MQWLNVNIKIVVVLLVQHVYSDVVGSHTLLL